MAEVKDHVRLVLKAMAPGGGYIACTSHNIQADTPLANLEALFEAYHDFGRYGVSGESAKNVALRDITDNP